MPKYQLLFTDLDGTLLNRRSEISAGNAAAIKSALSAGKRIVVASGRSWKSLVYFNGRLGLDAPGHYGIAFNGGVIYETSALRFIHEQPMDNALGKEIITALKTFGAAADIFVYAGGELYSERDELNLWHTDDKGGLTITVVDNFSEIQGDIIKVIAKGTNAGLTEIARRMEPLFTGRCNICFSAGELLEFLHPNANKGSAVEILAGYLRIPIEETIAMGDEANDITMLKKAGLGVAVANAVPGAKAAADIVLDKNCNESAVAAVIERYLLT